MGQREILDLLLKYPNKEFTKTQIEKALGEEYGHVCASLVQLRKNGEVEYWKNPSPILGRNIFYYRHKKTENFKIILRDLKR
jgi:predicted transcriptional regulator